MSDDDFAERLDRLLTAITKSHEAMIASLHVIRADMRRLEQRVARLERERPGVPEYLPGMMR